MPYVSSLPPPPPIIRMVAPAPSGAASLGGVVTMPNPWSDRDTIESPYARLERGGFKVQMAGYDAQREGTFSVPGDADWFVSVLELAKQAKLKGGIAATLTKYLSIHPETGAQTQPGVARIFVPGLNTPEPEASRRTQGYANELNLSLAHLHNGTRSSLGDIAPAEGDVGLHLSAGARDWVLASMVRSGLAESELGSRFAQLLEANFFGGSQPDKISAAFYSDATLAVRPAIREFKKRAQAHGVSPSDAEKLLRENVFIELHGNGVRKLEAGPRYLVWTDVNDTLTMRRGLLGGQTGLHAGRQDAANSDAVYVNYAGPFSKPGSFESHNLGASGMPAVAATLRLNQAKTPEELWTKGRHGEIAVPPKDSIHGHAEELWSR